MDISDIRPDPAGPTSPVHPTREDARRPDGEPADRDGARGDDRIDISDHGRALSRSAPESMPSGTLPADRLIDVRRRVQARFYDRPDVAEEVARRILERGDV